jgi:hypothetical protein
MLTSIREGSARKQTPLCAASKSVDAVRLVHIYNSLLEVLHFQPSSSNAIAMRQMKTSFGGSHSQRRCLFAKRSGSGVPASISVPPVFLPVDGGVRIRIGSVVGNLPSGSGELPGGVTGALVRRMWRRLEVAAGCPSSPASRFLARSALSPTAAGALSGTGLMSLPCSAWPSDSAAFNPNLDHHPNQPEYYRLLHRPRQSLYHHVMMVR